MTAKLIEKMITSRELSPAARDMDTFSVLSDWAEANAVEFVSVYHNGEWDDYGIEFESDNDTRRIILTSAYSEWHDIVLYFETTDADLLNRLAVFEKHSPGILTRDNSIDPSVEDMRVASK